MRNIFTLLLVSGILYLSSCSNGANDPLKVVPVADSSSYGSYVNIWFLSDTFLIKDLKLNGIATTTIHAKDTLNTTDSLWECRVQVTDATSKRINLNIFAVNAGATGSFVVTDNQSTLTDFSHGENKKYGIGLGSVINITQSTYPVIGKMHLTLLYNHDTTYAVDSFKIYN